MLYLVTNRSMAEEHVFLKVIRGAVEGGIDAIILREKDLTDPELLMLASDVQKIVQGSDTQLIINNSLAVANAIGAHGYHIGFQQFMREGPRFSGLTGVSIHSVEEGIKAQSRGASYLLAGHVFQTNSKKGVAPRGTPFIEKLKDHVTIPVIAIGGIHSGNIQQLVPDKTDGAAVMSEIMLAIDPCAKTKELKNLMK